MTEEREDDANWLEQSTGSHAHEAHTRLNYVIPEELERLLTQYCIQTEMKPGPLVRRLVTDFLKGDINCTEWGALDHPKGRRTSVDLPSRLLEQLEARCLQIKAPTKAAVIARLLADFLPARVAEDGSERVAISVPASIFNQIYTVYGPGGNDEVVVEALCDLIQRTRSRAIPAPQEV